MASCQAHLAENAIVSYKEAGYDYQKGFQEFNDIVNKENATCAFGDSSEYMMKSIYEVAIEAYNYDRFEI